MDDFKLAKTFAVNQAGGVPMPSPAAPQKSGTKPVDAVELDIACPKCKKQHKVPAYMDIKSEDITKAKLAVNPLIKDNDILVCDNCNFALDLKPIKSQIETQTKRKVTFK